MHARCQLLSGRISAQGLALRPAQSTQRTYATTAPTPAVKNPLQRRRGGDLGSHLPKNVIPKDAYIPAYPYGDHQLFKQANKGLYGEQMIRFGNNVSKDTETKTRRNWKPNVLSKSLYSVALKKKIKLRITAKVLKTMDREGGLDEYLLKDNVARIKELGPMGWALRWTLMQKPEVINRLRADAAALGIDQATIDKQWPTPQMMAEQRAAQGMLIRDVPSAAPENLEFAETEGQEMWSGEEVEDISDPKVVSKQEKKIRAFAAVEYVKAVKAAERYLSRSVVDSVEEGLKLAFVRAKEREEAAALLKHTFNRKYQEAGFTQQDLQEVREKFNLPHIKDHTARKIAFNQRKRKMIDEAGGIEAWNAAKNAAHNARIEEAGGEAAFLANRKLEYAALIAEAETASTNEAMDAERRSYLEMAIEKADRAIKAKAAGGQDDYVESVVEEWRSDQSRATGSGLSGIYQAAQSGRSAGGDAWGALVNESKKRADSRPRV
jgi:large subunit ribosomal protein L28